ncbi:MAG: hypothetical protein E6L09_14915 [Verrucomicrobia bacterium]|nr:MAG: hypothetical protein E6L09_14915 [Verrucomicrobiota bacterium]
MLASRGDIVARGEFFNDLDVRDQARACKDSLEQIVTEKRAFGNSLGECCLEHVYVINAFSAVRAFAEQILIDVRNGKGVRVQAAGTGKHALE